MASRRCPCRPGSARRIICLLLALELARLFYTTSSFRDLLAPMMPLLALFGGGGGHGYDHCSPHSIVTTLMAHKAAQNTGAAGPDCGRHISNASHPATLSLSPDCVCAADPNNGWLATPAGSWTAPIPCGPSSLSPNHAGLRRRHCGVVAAGQAQGRARWDVEHPPDTTQCGAWGGGSRNDDIRILFVSYKRSERLEVGNCAPINGVGVRSNRSTSNRSTAGLPNGGRCFLEPVDALQALPLTAFDAAVYDVASLPNSKLPAMLLDSSNRPTLSPLHTKSVVGVMSLEPTSYFALASEGCR